MVRRSFFFLTSYAPLAAMFVAVQWPAGWSAQQLAKLALGSAAITTTLVVGIAAAFFTKGRRKTRLFTIAAGTGAVSLLVLLAGWLGPATWDAPHLHSRTTVAVVAFAVTVAGIEAAALLFYGAKQTSELDFRVTDPRDQGGAVAGYLATYLLPLLSVSVHTWNVAAAYAIYFGALYVVFIRSDGLVLINPTLYLFGFRLLDVQLDPPDSPRSCSVATSAARSCACVGPSAANRRRILLIARTGITPPAMVTVVYLGDGCYLSVR